MDDLISRQDAIEILGKHCNRDYGKVCGKDCECIEYMAMRDTPSAQQWIPCSEKLPNIGESVLFSVGHGLYVSEGCLRADGRWAQFRWDAIQQDYMVDAWMPLPEPYKGESE